ncbi:hypothetical protein NDU88_006967 [Pleurodeles waltl]|uniref:Uncharacterized protein n=1 Tax=Pleurodeles waltl TaxID=8319 RepID=A0AAV7SR83_PLEWA|nr:hypothetical protein NDU88_006967 [Pleurodeles waltl]
MERPRGAGRGHPATTFVPRIMCGEDRCPILGLWPLRVSMATYDDQGGDEYYVDDPVGSFEQDLVYALDDGVRHTVDQALAQAIRPIKYHLIVYEIPH